MKIAMHYPDYPGYSFILGENASMSPSTPPPDVLAAMARAGVTPSPSQLADMEQFIHLLLTANERMNLTAIREPDEAWRRHVLDSLTVLPLLRGADLVADVGSGGGLPGIPLAIAAPGKAFTLVEATGKKARFLEEMKTELRLSNVQVRAERAETLGRDPAHRERYDAVVGRAVGPLCTFLELAMPLARVGGRVLALKGRKAEEEVKEAATALEQLGGTYGGIHRLLKGDDSAVIEIAKRQSTPDNYPRRPGMPKKRPL